MRDVDKERGARILAWADRHEITATQVADKLEVTPGTVRNWFAGIGQPRGGDALRLQLWKRGFLDALTGPEIPEEVA